MERCSRTYPHKHGRRHVEIRRSRSYSPRCTHHCEASSCGTSASSDASDLSDTSENQNREVKQEARDTNGRYGRRREKSCSFKTPEIILCKNNGYQIVARKKKVIKENTSENFNPQVCITKKSSEKPPSSRWNWFPNILYGYNKANIHNPNPCRVQSPTSNPYSKNSNNVKDCTSNRNSAKGCTSNRNSAKHCTKQSIPRCSPPVKEKTGGWLPNISYYPNNQANQSCQHNKVEEHCRPCRPIKQRQSCHGIPIKIGNTVKIVHPNDNYRVKLILYTGDGSKDLQHITGKKSYCCACLNKTRGVCDMKTFCTKKPMDNCEQGNLTGSLQERPNACDTECNADTKETDKSKKSKKEKKDKKGPKEKNKKDKEKSDKKEKKPKEKSGEEDKGTKEKKKVKTSEQESQDTTEITESGKGGKKTTEKKDKENEKKKNEKSRKEKIVTREETVIKDGETHTTRDTTAEITDKGKSNEQGNVESLDKEKVLSLYRMRTIDKQGQEIDIVLNRNGTPKAPKIDDGIVFKNIKEVAPRSLGEQIVIKNKTTQSRKSSLWQRDFSSDYDIKFKNIRDIAPKSFRDMIVPGKSRGRDPQKLVFSLNQKSSAENSRYSTSHTTDSVEENHIRMEALKIKKIIMSFIHNIKRKILKNFKRSKKKTETEGKNNQGIISEEPRSRELTNIILTPRETTNTLQNTARNLTIHVKNDHVEPENTPSVFTSTVSYKKARNEFRRILHKVKQRKENDKTDEDLSKSKKDEYPKPITVDNTNERNKFRKVLEQVTHKKERDESFKNNVKIKGKESEYDNETNQLTNPKEGDIDVNKSRKSSNQPPSTDYDVNIILEELKELREALAKHLLHKKIAAQMDKKENTK